MPLAHRVEYLFDFLKKRPLILLLACLALTLPALLINLGVMPLIADEPIRALVALELMDSGNLFVSTMRGEYYYNKPPLFNWLLILLFKLTGSQSEFVIRLPTVFFLITFALSIYLIVKQYLGRKVAFVTALAFVTCSRILFYDAFLGLIDILFSWLTYLQFMAIFYFHEKKKWLPLFLVSYGVVAIGFMLKGLPSFVFQGIALSVFFFYTGTFRKLFSWQHLLGMLMMLSIIGAYFFLYSRYNSLEVYLRTLWTESSKRTVAENSLQDSVLHLFTFPFSFLQHFLPWSVFLLCLFRKGIFRVIRSDRFLTYNAVIFLACIPIYWLSPLTIPRYLFMLVPQFYTLIVYFFYRYQLEKPWQNRLIEWAFLAAAIIVSLALLAPPFVELTRSIPGVLLKSIGLFLVSASITYLLFRLPRYRMELMMALLFVIRIGFDWFIFPARLQTSPEVAYRAYGIEVGKRTKGQPLYLYQDTYIDNDVTFYITRERADILRRDTTTVQPSGTRPNAFYLTEDRHLANRQYTKHYDFTIDQGLHLNLVQFRD